MNKEFNVKNLKDYSGKELIAELCRRGAEIAESAPYSKYSLKEKYSNNRDELKAKFLILNDIFN